MPENPHVQFLGNGIIGIALDWPTLVTGPAARNDYQSAFAAADALIDRLVGVIFRQIYRQPESRDVIDEIQKKGSRPKAMMEAIKKKMGDFEEIEERIKSFKRERNLVIHNVEAHYKLVAAGDLQKIADGAVYDSIAKQAANKSLREAFAIFNDLVEKLRGIKSPL